MLPNFSWRDFVREITIESQIFIRFFSIDRMSKSFFFSEFVLEISREISRERKREKLETLEIF